MLTYSEGRKKQQIYFMFSAGLLIR
ncbi:hypothetical protein SBA2_630043 [Acidobacteriia bacterium SbA2]|nr:hypothetical protein SBA2_630043 [Acidobacteriia bacterium SbA2]